MAAPLAYIITWTTHGTWLPGDKRGWVESGKRGIRAPDRQKKRLAGHRMSDTSVALDDFQRRIVEETIQSHCRIRKWTLRALNVRSNHVHLVVTAPVEPEIVMNQLKAWCSRRLNEHLQPPARSASKGRQQSGQKKKWWTEHGSTKWINDESYLQNAIRYVMEGQ